MKDDTLSFNGMWRGTVVDNYDPLVKGRLKIYVPGVYPEEMAKEPSNLPWSEPCLSLFGGNWTNEREGDLNTETGVTTIPHTSSTPLQGAQVWVFFENGSHTHPVHFAACQGGAGWHSEHNNQHVIKTDNVRVRIDENPGHPKSTCKFTSYNESNNERSQQQVIQNMPTRVDIEVWNEGANAVNIIVKGNVNMKIEGDVYEEHIGNKHLTHIGNVYKQHDGEVYEVHNGTTITHQFGRDTKHHTGDKIYIQQGDKSYYNTHGDFTTTIFDGSMSTTCVGDNITNVMGLSTTNFTGDQQINYMGNLEVYVAGNNTLTSQEFRIFTTEDLLAVSKEGNMIFECDGVGAYTSKSEDNPNKLRGGIIMNGNYIKQSGNGTSTTTPWTYDYDPTQTDTIPITPGIEDVTGTTIHHNSGYSSGPEYNTKEA